MDKTRPEIVAVAMKERCKLLRLAGGSPRFFRVVLGPQDEKGRRIRDLEKLRTWPWADSILTRHGVKDALVGLHPNGFYFGVGIVDGRYLPGPHRNRREGFAYLRFEVENEPLPIVKVIARLDALAQLRIAKEESWPFAVCPRCGEVAWRVYNRVLDCCGRFEFEGRAFENGTWKRIGERTDNKYL